MKILFCMATGQNVVNINPLSAIRPDKVVVFITHLQKESSQSLIHEIKNSGFKIDIETIDIQNENSLKELNAQFSQVIEKYIDDELIANITGGTKLMSMSLYQLFGAWGFRSFYCDFASGQMIWLDDESSVANIGANVSLARYLRTYQYQITDKTPLAQIPQSHKKYADILYQALCKTDKNYDETCDFIGKIHALTHPNTQNNARLNKSEVEFLCHLETETQLFSYNQKENKIQFNHQDAQKLMSGAWLEIIVAEALRGDAYRDIHVGVYFEKSTQRKNSATRQELDVMAMYHDKLLIVECKAKKWQNNDQANEAIYKLSALSDIGGLNTLPVFVSLRDVPPSVKTRAAEQGIKIIAGQADLIGLKARLKQ